MARFPQPAGFRGSLKWIQRAVNAHPEVLDSAILPRLNKAGSIQWLSPLVGDDFAEYRDAAFLQRLGRPELAPRLAEFWPARGPQWDALALSDAGDILLVEAKAHLDELFSPATQASIHSRKKIEAALNDTMLTGRVQARGAWTDLFYQLGNRLAHLHFLRANGCSAYLVLVNFLGDADMNGLESTAEWEAAYRVVLHVMGVPADSPLLRYTVHVYPRVSILA